MLGSGSCVSMCLVVMVAVLPGCYTRRMGCEAMAWRAACRSDCLSPAGARPALTILRRLVTLANVLPLRPNQGGVGLRTRGMDSSLSRARASYIGIILSSIVTYQSLADKYIMEHFCFG